MSGQDVDAVVEIDERYSQMLARPTLYRRATDKDLIELLLGHAAGFGLGAAWGVSQISDQIEEICQRYLKARQYKPGDRLPGGLRVVPEEPTDAMVTAGARQVLAWNPNFDSEELPAWEAYVAMLAASGD